jgi:hypothetical protein
MGSQSGIVRKVGLVAFATRSCQICVRQTELLDVRRSSIPVLRFGPDRLSLWLGQTRGAQLVAQTVPFAGDARQVV